MSGFQVHGLGHELVAADWPPLTDAEVRELLAGYPLAGAPSARIIWRSPRPLSAAALVESGTETVFVKRHDRRVRTVPSLTAEHRFAAHLRSRAVAVAEVLADGAGATAVQTQSGVYEVHGRAPGDDRYRDAPSWTGYGKLADARAAGAALAALHLAAADFTHAARAPGPLTNGVWLASAADPVATAQALLAQRPGLALALTTHPFAADLERELAPAIATVAPALARLPPQWGHGDWHPSNLTWSAGPAVAAVLDLGLSNRTYAVHDLATAIERACISWLGPGSPAADLAAVTALLDGYETIRSLSAEEVDALATLLPVVHLEFALSEIEYYGAVLGSPARAAIAYQQYLIGHLRWFQTPAGAVLTGAVRARRRDARRRSPSPPR